MGLFDIFADIGGGILGGVKKAGRELGETVEAAVGAFAPAVFGSPVEPDFRVDKSKAVGTFLGGALGRGFAVRADDFLTGEAERRAGPGGLVSGAQQGPGGATVRQPRTGRPIVVPGSFTGEPQELPVETQMFQRSFAQMPTPVALPGGALVPQVLRALPSVGGGAVGGAVTEGLMALFGGGGMVGPGASPGTIFRVQGERLVPRRTFEIMNPSTGRTVFYRNMGRPILWSGDLSACKRVNKAASRARRRRGGR